jgi:hypothetical protein
MDKAQDVFEALVREETDEPMQCYVCYDMRLFARTDKRMIDPHTCEAMRLWRCRTCSKSRWIVAPWGSGGGTKFTIK